MNLKKMSKVFIPLSLMTVSCGFASEVADNCCPTTNCCPTNCCRPCCVPQPKKCIDCECYLPQYYDLQCDWGMFVTADFLYWYAHETNLEYANRVQYTLQQPDTTLTGVQYGYITKHNYLKTKWDPGLRVGIGMNLDCDGWDVYLNWTYFDNHSHSAANQPLPTTPQQLSVTGLINGVNDPWAPVDQVRDFLQLAVPRVSAKWSVIFNQMDLEFGRKFWISKCMLTRLYTGLRGAWTHTNFSVNASYNATYLPLSGRAAGTVTEVAQIRNKFKNRLWGVGILGGLQPEFVFGDWIGCGVCSLYGNFEGALIWGKYRGRNQFLLQATSSDVSNFNGGSSLGTGTAVAANPLERDSFSRMQGILDVGIGLRWEEHWCCDRYSTSIDFGWEHHYWFDFGLYHRAIAGAQQTGPAQAPEFVTPLGSNNFSTNLGFGGLVIRARLDF